MTLTIPFAEGEANLDWLALTDALEAGHTRPRAEIGDTFLYRGADTLLSRSAVIDGLGIAVKSATVFPGNPDAGKPVVNGAVSLFSDTDGTLQAILDFHLVTKWKTAGDSLLAARKLARPDSRNILIVGSGTVAHALHDAYGCLFPNAQFAVWSRNPESAARFAAATGARVARDLEPAVGDSDIVTCATMTTEPILRGDWLAPGTHVDLIGAYRPDMREADDTVLRRGRVFVDSYETTVEHIGEVKIPLENGVIPRSHLVADYYEMERFGRMTPDDITVFKNGGGAHLDLMTARYILEQWQG